MSRHIESRRALVCPSDLEDLFRAFVADEAAASLRHDVRNKLSATRNAAFYVKRKLEGQPELLAADPRIMKFMAMIDEEMAALGDIGQARLPAQDPNAAHEVVPKEICERLVERVEVPSGHRVTLDLSNEGPVRADPRELEIALFCLLENAIEATLGLATPAVALESVGSDAGVCIRVRDNGPGFSASAISDALRPFFTTKPGRLGVGLKVTRRFAMRHGATLDLGAADESGARVTLTLRRAAP